MAILRLERTGVDLELLDGINAEVRSRGASGSAIRLVIDVRAVKQKKVCRRTLAVDAEALPAAGLERSAGDWSGIRRNNVRLNERQLVVASAVQRKRTDRRFVHQGPDRRRRRFHNRG